MKKLHRPLRKIHRLATIPIAILFPFNVATKKFAFHDVVEIITGISIGFMILTGVVIFFTSMKKKKPKEI